MTIATEVAAWVALLIDIVVLGCVLFVGWRAWKKFHAPLPKATMADFEAILQKARERAKQ